MGSPTLSCDARVAVPGPTGTKKSDADGKLTQLHRRVFAPRNKEKTLTLGTCVLGQVERQLFCLRVFCVFGLMAFEVVAMRRSWPRQAWEMGHATGPFPNLPTARMRALPESVGEAVVPRKQPQERTAEGDGTAAGRQLTGHVKEREVVVVKWVIILQTPSGYGALLGKAKGKEMSQFVVECAAG